VSAPGRHARPRRSRALRWHQLPLPLAALFVIAMPWVAVRDVRRSNRAFRQLCEILVIAVRQRDQAEEARSRRLHLVR